MKIILVVTGLKGRNAVFVSDTLKSYTVEETVRLAKEGSIENVYAVEAKNGAYVRTKPHTAKTEQLEHLAISSHQLFAFANDIRSAVSTPALARYLKLYGHSLEQEEGPYIVIGGQIKITTQAAKEKLQPHKELIFEAAEKFKIDPYLLGAIVIDEIAQFGLLENITDLLASYFIGINTSTGIAQVKLETARGLIKDGYYNPNPHDPKLARDKINKTPRKYLYQYVKEPKHSIFFAAARMRELIDKWKRFVNLAERPEIISTLYSMYKLPHANPQANARGLQITNEFYPLVKKWLR